jgi:hypothetical protein
MRFSKTDDNIFKIERITGNQNNILGISFSEDDIEVKVIEWYFNNTDKSKILTSKEEVLEQVFVGLKAVNESLQTNYKLSKIYFSPFDIPANGIYSRLIARLIIHYHNGNEFK